MAKLFHIMSKTFHICKWFTILNTIINWFFSDLIVICSLKFLGVVNICSAVTTFWYQNCYSQYWMWISLKYSWNLPVLFQSKQLQYRILSIYNFGAKRVCRVSVPSLKNDILPGGVVDLWCHNDVASSKNKEKRGWIKERLRSKLKRTLFMRMLATLPQTSLLTRFAENKSALHCC